jgi:hypothetical protein
MTGKLEDVQSIHECAVSAIKYDYIYFALQNGSQCWVSNNISNAKRYGIAYNCDMKCQYGVGSCGGVYANALYTIGETIVPSFASSTPSPNQQIQSPDSQNYIL